MQVLPDRLVFEVERVEEVSSGRGKLFGTVSALQERRLTCFGLDDPERVLEDLVQAGAVAPGQVVHVEPRAQPGQRTQVASTLLALALIGGGIAGASYLRHTQRIWAGVLVLLATLGVGVPLLKANLGPLMQIWFVHEDDERAS